MKTFLLSKTIWAAALYAALIAFSPLIQGYVSKNPTIAGCSVAAIFIFLRIITKKGVKL